MFLLTVQKVTTTSSYCVVYISCHYVTLMLVMITHVYKIITKQPLAFFSTGCEYTVKPLYNGRIVSILHLYMLQT